MIWGLTYRMFENLRVRAGGQVMRLSPIDHVFTGRGAYPIEFVFAYGGPLDAEPTRRQPAADARALPGGRPAASSGCPASAYGLEPADDGCVFEVATSPHALRRRRRPARARRLPWRRSRASRSRASA